MPSAPGLAALWARATLGLDTGHDEEMIAARQGARFQWLNRDLAAGYARGPSGLIGALAVAPFAAHSMWSARDPMPAARYLLPEGLRRLRARVGGH